MTFKKDYINYLLHTVVNSNNSGFRDNYRLSKLVDTILSMDDVMKMTYLIGKTAGLEGLFKYLLYISDKIDKSQVTIFNLKDNFDYDIRNLTKICEKINQYKSENVQEAIENIEEEMETEERSAMTINTDDNEGGIVVFENTGEYSDENDDSEDTGKLTLIENKESQEKEAEVFDLESITDSVENSDAVEIKNKIEDTVDEEIDEDEESSDEDTEVNGISRAEDDIIDSEDDENTETEVIELDETDEIIDENESDTDETEIESDDIVDEVSEIVESELDLEIEVRKPTGSAQEEEHHKEETITSEAYIKFETKFFEEVKILEKLFAAVDKDCKTDETGKLSEKCLQCFTEIIEITSELSSLSRQLSFDLIADIFLTMNLYTTKAISLPEILTGERIKLLDSSLALVNSLIKGEDYLNYDSIVDKIEQLKQDISGEKEEKYQEPEQYSEHSDSETSDSGTEIETQLGTEQEITEASEITEPIAKNENAAPQVIEKPQLKQSQMDSAVFKLKYLVKEFEKSFVSIETLKGEYSKYDALEKIAELNNALRLIAKISAIIKNNDVLKLAEVTYVFLKYVKDYRMDLMEPEIKQIVKYIIFTFKMLLTNRKPEDFNVLVQHLNNPVKIFADS